MSEIITTNCGQFCIRLIRTCFGNENLIATTGRLHLLTIAYILILTYKIISEICARMLLRPFKMFLVGCKGLFLLSKQVKSHTLFLSKCLLVIIYILNYLIFDLIQTVGQFFCVGLGFMFYLLCLDSCQQTYVLRKMKTARFMLCLS